MKEEELGQLCSAVQKVAQEVGSFIHEEVNRVSKSDIEEKVENSLVSYVDKEAEKKLVKLLGELLPAAGFITEENTVKQEDKSLKWIIDPLDGTTNYLFGIPHYSTSIALSIDNTIVLGVVRDIAKNETFHSVVHQGAYMDDRLLKLSGTLEMSESIFVTGFPYKNDYNADGLLDVIKYLIKHSRGIRRLGSAAIDLCYAASGRISCYYEGFLNIWDIAAGALIAQEAGAHVSDFNNEDKHLDSGQIIACHPDIRDNILDIIQKSIST